MQLFLCVLALCPYVNTVLSLKKEHASQVFAATVNMRAQHQRAKSSPTSVEVRGQVQLVDLKLVLRRTAEEGFMGMPVSRNTPKTCFSDIKDPLYMSEEVNMKPLLTNIALISSALRTDSLAPSIVRYN